MIAALHSADLTCRPQIVDDDSGLATILAAYRQLTGRGVVLNTSLNLHDRPIARAAAAAVAVLQRSDLAHLQLGSFMISKSLSR